MHQNTVGHLKFSDKNPPKGAEKSEESMPTPIMSVINRANLSRSNKSRATAFARIRPDAINRP